MKECCTDAYRLLGFGCGETCIQPTTSDRTSMATKKRQPIFFDTSFHAAALAASKTETRSLKGFIQHHMAEHMPPFTTETT